MSEGRLASEGVKRGRITYICEIQHAAVNRANCPVSDRTGVPCEIQPFAGSVTVSHASFHTNLIDCLGNTECVCSTYAIPMLYLDVQLIFFILDLSAA